MNVRVVKNFINLKDIFELNNWTLSNYHKEFFNISEMNDLKTRYTTRQCSNRKVDKLFNYPKISYKIQKRIIDNFELERFNKANIGKDGIVTGIGFENDYIYEHVDPFWYPQTHTIHFNIITQKSQSGGITIIENNEYEVDNGDILIYNVSQHKHRVSKVIGKIPRILWVFGFCVDDDKLKQIFTDKKEIKIIYS
jgi:hypothetical protein